MRTAELAGPCQVTNRPAGALRSQCILPAVVQQRPACCRGPEHELQTPAAPLGPLGALQLAKSTGKPIISVPIIKLRPLPHRQ